MTKRTSLREHLRSSFWIYLLIVVLAIALWTTVFGQLARPAANEQVSILIIGGRPDGAALEKDLTARIGELTRQPIREISVDAVGTTDQTAAVQLLAARINDTDIVILTEEMLEDFPVQTFFPTLPQEKTDMYFPRPQYYCVEDAPYGVLLYDGEENGRFGAFCGGSDAYYAFFSGSSVNFGGLTGQGGEHDDAALAVLKYLLE